MDERKESERKIGVGLCVCHLSDTSVPEIGRIGNFKVGHHRTAHLHLEKLSLPLPSVSTEETVWSDY